jgi:hypothetical protein
MPLAHALSRLLRMPIACQQSAMKDLFILFVVSVAASACAVAVTTGGVIDGPMAAWSSAAPLADEAARTTPVDRSSSEPEPCAGFSFLR